MQKVDDLYRLDMEDVQKASSIMSRAFFEDPDLKMIIPDDDRRREYLKVMFQPFVRFGIIYGEVYVPTPNIEGVAVWNHSSSKSITTWRSIRSGFFGMVSKLNSEERKIFTRYGKEMDARTKYLLKGEHWFLFILGVDPDHQRKGLGTMMLKPMLKRADSENLPVMLDTNKEANISYYERFGFKVKSEYKVLDNQHWGLVREK
jgi:GNAT superfamily N-acetyltransferase